MWLLVENANSFKIIVIKNTNTKRDILKTL